jgi:hypothetical protein
MKSRPRSVENRVADAMNSHFSRLGMSSVERIPVLGRTGPDLSINEMGLAVDVKSRIEVPKAIFFPLGECFRFDGMTAVRLTNLYCLWEDFTLENPTDRMPALLDYSSKTIRDYLAHMDEWTQAHEPNGISCIVLHRPEVPIGSSVAIIYSNCRRRLYDRTTEYQQRSDHPVPAE